MGKVFLDLLRNKKLPGKMNDLEYIILKIKRYILGPIATNCYLVEKEKEKILIDPAAGSYATISLEVADQRLPVFLTHSHWDHIADAHLWKKRGSEVWVHRLDAPNLEKPGSDLLPSVLDIPGISPDHFLESSKDIPILGTTLKVLLTPGHSPGSVCLYFPEEGILFSGDTLFKGSVGSTLFPTSDRNAMQNSLRLLATLPETTIVYPGHGEETAIGEEPWIQRAMKR